jgi:hypothetical protein
MVSRVLMALAHSCKHFHLHDLEGEGGGGEWEGEEREKERYKNRIRTRSATLISSGVDSLPSMILPRNFAHTTDMHGFRKPR